MPLTVPALTVTGLVPVELSVTELFLDAFTPTVPKLTLVALSASVDTGTTRLTVEVTVCPPAAAFTVAVWAELTAEAVPVKLAPVAPAGTVNDEGTANAAKVLDRFNAAPPVAAAALSVTVHVPVPAPAIVLGAQVRPVGNGRPVPVKLIVDVAPLDELLLKVKVLVAPPAAVGLNTIFRVAVLPTFNVSGKLTPEMVNTVPLTDAALTVSADVPDEVSVNCSVPVSPTPTIPKLTFVALSVSAGAAEPRAMA